MKTPAGGLWGLRAAGLLQRLGGVHYAAHSSSLVRINVRSGTKTDFHVAWF